MTNIAKRFIDYYEHEDFISNYVWVLAEIFNDNKETIIETIIDSISMKYSDFDGHALLLTEKQAGDIYQYINDNFDDFVTPYNGYYVGHTCLESCEFGEQEEQLTGIYNHKTGKDYSLQYLKRICDEEGFYVSGDYAYYNLDGGIYIELDNGKCPLLEELIDNYMEEVK